MKKVLVGLLFFFQIQASAQGCKDMFLSQSYHRKSQLDKEADNIDRDLKFESMDLEYKALTRIRWWTKLNQGLKSMSGNKFESMTRQLRIRFGDRVMRLMRASPYRATNYTRSVWQNTRVAAGMLLYYQIKVYKLEKDIASGRYRGKRVQKAREYIEILTKRAYKEAKRMNRYGDYQMIISQLLAYRSKYSKNTDAITEALKEPEHILESSVIMAESMVIRDVIRETEVEVTGGIEGFKTKEAEEALREHVDKKVTNLAEYGSGMYILKKLFPEILSLPDSLTGKTPKEDKVDFALRKESDFVRMVFRGAFFEGTGYRPVAVEGPLLYTVRRDVAWEALAVVRNNISALFKPYARLIKSIDAVNMKSILSKRIEQQEKSTNATVSNAAKKLTKASEKFNTLDIKLRKAIHWTLDNLTVMDAITVHAKKMEYYEELVSSVPSGLANTGVIVRDLGMESLARPDFIPALARVRDYREVFRSLHTIVTQEVQKIKAKPNYNERDSWEAELLLKEMDNAWMLVKSKDLKEVTLIDEPGFVQKVLNQSVYIAAPALMFSSIWAFIDPVGFAAFLKFMPGIL